MDTYTGEVSEIPLDDQLPVLRVLTSVLVGLPVVSQAFKASPFLSYDWLGNPLDVPLERFSFLISPPATEGLDH